MKTLKRALCIRKSRESSIFWKTFGFGIKVHTNLCDLEGEMKILPGK